MISARAASGLTDTTLMRATSPYMWSETISFSSLARIPGKAAARVLANNLKFIAGRKGFPQVSLQVKHLAGQELANARPEVVILAPAHAGVVGDAPMGDKTGTVDVVEVGLNLEVR